jgi:hypothetical protein
VRAKRGADKGTFTVAVTFWENWAMSFLSLPTRLDALVPRPPLGAYDQHVFSIFVGTLHLDVPLGPQQARRDVQVVIESVTRPRTPAEYATWVQPMAGTWQGDFERPPQGEYAHREPFE